MAISQTERDQILKIVAGLFNGAPGGAILNDLSQAVEAGVSMAQLADILANTNQFKQDIIGGKVTTAQQVSVLMNNFGLTPDGEAGSPATLAAEFFTARIEGGAGFGAIVLEAVNFLDNTTNEAFAPYSALLNNKALVAALHAESNNISGVADAQTILAGVTAAFPTTAAEAAQYLNDIGSGTNPGQAFTLTVSEDNLVGTAGDDIFNAPVVSEAGNLVQTLQDIDQLNGGEGTDTLNATLNSGAAVTPSLNSIENVNIRSVANGSGIDFSASSGVEKITVANSTGTTAIKGAGAFNNIAVNNQTSAVGVDGSTATSMNLSFNKFGTKDAQSTIDVNTGNATSATVNTTDSNVNVGTLASLNALTVAATGDNKLASASNGAIETLTVSGSGSLAFDGNLTALKTLTSTAEGAITVTGLGAGFETATTGAGDDSITVATATGVKNISTGAGNDTVTITGALTATAVVDLGEGDDTLILNSTPTAGVTLTGGEGRDTLQTTQTIFGDIAGFTDEQKAKVTGFEVLSISTALTNGSTVDLAGIAGITNFVAAAGVVAGGSANVTNLGQNATVEIAGNNTGTVGSAAVAEIFTMKITAGNVNTADSTIDFDGIQIVLANGLGDPTAIAGDFATKYNLEAGRTWDAANNLDGTITFTARTAEDRVDIVTGNFVYSDGGSPDTTAVVFDVSAPTTQGVDAVPPLDAGALVLSQETDTAADVLNLKLNNNYTENNDATSTITGLTNTITASKVETLNVESTGNASTEFLGAEGHVADGVNNTLALTNNDLVTLNVTGDQAFTFESAAGMTKLATIDASALTAGATIDASAHVSDSAALTITGSATAANDLTGGATADTIIGGEAADTITSSAGADTITLGGGNDTYVLANATDSVVNARDVITDFNANTVGQGTNGAATVAGAAAADLRNGDVIDLSAFIGGGGQPADGVNVAVFANASDATTFLANSAGGGAAGSAVNVALDSSIGALYLDINDNGIADSVITLTGVETIDAAAFVTGL